MARASNGDVELYYQREGSGETVAFVEDAGLGAWQWGWQHAALAGPYETLTWDLRGTGRSDDPEEGYSVVTMAADLEAVLAAHGARRAHLVGAGLGGMVALEHALEYDRARSLALLGTTARGTDLAADPAANRCVDPDDADALLESTAALVSGAFCREHPDVLEGIVEWRREDDAVLDACRRQVAVMEGFDRNDRLHEITVPALVIHGGDDGIVPIEAGRRLADRLPRGEFDPHEGAGHLVGLERSRPVNDRLVGFLADLTK